MRSGAGWSGWGSWEGAGAFLIYDHLIERLDAIRASGATCIAPVVAVIIGTLAGETVAAPEILAWP